MTALVARLSLVLGCLALWPAVGRGDRVSFPLDGPADTPIVAGSGRYLLVHKPDRRECSVISVADRKVVRVVSIGANALIAASAENFFVADADEGTLERWSLETLEPEQKVALPFAKPQDIACGGYANGPLLLVTAGPKPKDVYFLDSQTLLPLDLPRLEGGDDVVFGKGRERIRASGDGRLFAAMDGSFGYTVSLIVEPEGYRMRRTSEAAATVKVGFTGDIIHTKAGPLSADLIPLAGRESPMQHSLTPAVDSEWAIRSNYDEASLVLPNSTLPPIALRDLGVEWQLYRHMEDGILLVDQETLCVRNRTDQSIELIGLNLSEYLRTLRVPHVAVLSTPVVASASGQEYRYLVEVASSTGEFTATVLAGPEGMHFNAATGELVWKVPGDAESGTSSVLLLLSNYDGAEIYHAFTITNRGTRTGRPIAAWSASEIPTTSLAPRRPYDQPYDLVLPAPASAVTLAASGRYLCVHMASIAHIAVVDLRERAITTLLRVPRGAAYLAGSAEKLFVLSPDEDVLIRFNLATRGQEIQHDLQTPDDVTPREIACGAYGNGPVGIIYQREDRTQPWRFELRNPDSFEVLHQAAAAGPQVQVSGDGSFFTTSGQRMRIHPTWALHESPPEASVAASPNFNGSMLGSNFGCYPAALYRSPSRKGQRKLSLPAAHGSVYMQFEEPLHSDAPPSTRIEVFTQGNDEFVEAFGNLPEFYRSRDNNWTSREDPIQYFDRLWLVPSIRTLAVIPRTYDRVHLRQFDPLASRASSGEPYLFVDSLPPAYVYRGDTISYEIQVVGSNTVESFEIQESPEGARLEGKTLHWQAPADFQADSAHFTIAVRDASGHSLMHSFDVAVSAVPTTVIQVAASRDPERNDP